MRASLERTTPTAVKADENDDDASENTAYHAPHPKHWPLLCLRSLGIVYGDIGTSPIYCLSTIFAPISSPDASEVRGAVSLVLYTIMIMVFVKYVIFILMADNHGDGSTFALSALLTGHRSWLGRRSRTMVSAVSLLAISFVLADGAFTPAVSVLSAVEGLTIISASAERAILPVTIVILVLIFAAQRLGTSWIGIAFGPIMFVWFVSLAVIGVYWTIHEPSILLAFNPWEGLRFIGDHTSVGAALATIGSVFLAITGVEALYADIGHLGKWPVRISWTFLVMPALMLVYLGQGALLLINPDYSDSPHFKAAGPYLFWPFFVLTLTATIIASQAMITASFSVVAQAVSLGYAPPLHVVHTSKRIFGQIYMPEVNLFLFVVTVAIVVGFKHSVKVASAYGVTVCTVMVITTLLYTGVLRYTWHLWWPVVLLFPLFFVAFDGAFLVANYYKIPEGAWVALLIALVLTMVLLSWWIGETRLRTHQTEHLPHLELEQVARTLSDGHSSYECLISRKATPATSVASDVAARKSTDDKVCTRKSLDGKLSVVSMDTFTNAAVSSPSKKTSSNSDSSGTSSSESNTSKSYEAAAPNKSSQQHSSTSNAQQVEEGAAQPASAGVPAVPLSVPSVSHSVGVSTKQLLSDTRAQALASALDQLSLAVRIPGCGVFLSTSALELPVCFENYVVRFPTLSETIIFLSVHHEEVPVVARTSRIELNSLGGGIYQLKLFLGYTETGVNVAAILDELQHDGNLPMNTTERILYYLNRVHVKVRSPGWLEWRAWAVWPFLVVGYHTPFFLLPLLTPFPECLFSFVLLCSLVPMNYFFCRYTPFSRDYSSAALAAWSCLPSIRLSWV